MCAQLLCWTEKSAVYIVAWLQVYNDAYYDKYIGWRIVIDYKRLDCLLRFQNASNQIRAPSSKINCLIVDIKWHFKERLEAMINIMRCVRVYLFICFLSFLNSDDLDAAVCFLKQQVLGVPKTATEDEIKKAYKKLA
jgi:hypothetical protein